MFCVALPCLVLRLRVAHDARPRLDRWATRCLASLSVIERRKLEHYLASERQQQPHSLRDCWGRIARYSPWVVVALLLNVVLVIAALRGGWAGTQAVYTLEYEREPGVFVHVCVRACVRACV